MMKVMARTTAAQNHMIQICPTQDHVLGPWTGRQDPIHHAKVGPVRIKQSTILVVPAQVFRTGSASSTHRRVKVTPKYQFVQLSRTKCFKFHNRPAFVHKADGQQHVHSTHYAESQEKMVFVVSASH